MPTYEYACSSCSHHWEEVQRISEPASTVCPNCKNETARRQISAGNFILKGGGWYADLYSSAKKNGDSSKASANGSSGSSGGASDSAKTSDTGSSSSSSSTSSGGSAGTSGGASSPSTSGKGSAS